MRPPLVRRVQLKTTLIATAVLLMSLNAIGQSVRPPEHVKPGAGIPLTGQGKCADAKLGDTLVLDVRPHFTPQDVTPRFASLSFAWKEAQENDKGQLPPFQTALASNGEDADHAQAPFPERLVAGWYRVYAKLSETQKSGTHEYTLREVRMVAPYKGKNVNFSINSRENPELLQFCINLKTNNRGGTTLSGGTLSGGVIQ